MESFEVILPSKELSPYVKNYWFLSAEAVNQVQEIIPTGTINLFIHRGNPLSLHENEVLLPDMFISGQVTDCYKLIQSGVTDMICIAFHAYGARMFFNESMHTLKGQFISLDQLENPGIVDLGKRLQETSDNQTCVHLIEMYLKVHYLHTSAYNFKRIATVVEAIDRGHTSIDELAAISCLSYKQFKRVFSEYVGLNPKEFVRIVRFQRALYALQTNPSINLTELAFLCEFYDQSHMISEFKHFSGYTPKEYLAICEPYSDYFSY